MSNQDRSCSASHLTLSTKEAKLPVFNDFPLPTAQEELCISLNYCGPWFTWVAKHEVSLKKMRIWVYIRSILLIRTGLQHMCVCLDYISSTASLHIVRHSLHNVISPSSHPNFHPYECQTRLISHTAQEGCHLCSYMQIWTVTYHWTWSSLQESKFSASWESCLGGGK